MLGEFKSSIIEPILENKHRNQAESGKALADFSVNNQRYFDELIGRIQNNVWVIMY